MEFTGRQYEECNFDIDVIAAEMKSVCLVSEGHTKYCDRLLGIIEDKHPNTGTSLSAEMKTKFSQSAHKEKLNISALDCKKKCEFCLQTFRTTRDLNDHIQSQHKGE